MIALALSAALQCLPLPDMVAGLDDAQDQHEITRAAEDSGFTVLTFVSPQGTWTLVTVAPDMTACMVAAGTGYMMVAPGVMN